MMCGDLLPLAFDFDSLTAVAAERCSRSSPARVLALQPTLLSGQEVRFSVRGDEENEKPASGGRAGVSSRGAKRTGGEPDPPSPQGGMLVVAGSLNDTIVST